jgi:hypothetical protein
MWGCANRMEMDRRTDKQDYDDYGGDTLCFVCSVEPGGLALHPADSDRQESQSQR